MADAIVRLKVESQEYDSKLKRAADQMARMEQEVRRTGASFAYADKEEIAFVQSLGQMGTQAQSAKQKMREYTDALTSLTATYRAMSDEEKSSEFGKAMVASIDQIKVKAAELKDIMSDTQREITNLASDTSFTDGLNLMTRTIGASASAIVAWTGDSKEMEAVIKDLAKIGTTVAAVDQLTKAFQKQNLVLLKNPYVAAAAAVVALGVAIGKLIKKSQELSAVDKALQDVQQKGRENSAKEITRIDTLNNILHDNTRSLEERKTALAEIQNLVPDYHGALTEEGNLINDNTGAIDNYIDGLQRAAIAQAAFDKMVELQKKKMQQQMELQEKQNQLKVEQARNQQAQGQVVYAGSEMTQVYTQQGENAAARAVQKVEADIRQTEAEIEAVRNLVRANDIGTTGDKTSKSVGTVKVAAEIELPEGSAAKLKQKIAELRKQWDVATTQGDRDSLDGQIKAAEEELAKMTPEVKQVADVIRNAAAMWKEHVDKIADVKARLEEFKAMMEDSSLSDAQRDWAAGMADAYQEQLDKMKGVTKEAVDDIKNKMKELPSIFDQNREALDRMSAGVGAISTLGNAFNDLKGIGEDLADAFSGEMDAWDALMTVFNSGIGILETVVGVMEAINTLQELAGTLSDMRVAKQAAETTAVVTGKGAEVAATTAEASVSAAELGVDTADATAKAAKSVAWIPIAGPALAAAAIAAILGAIMGAQSQAKSAGKFAQGGIVPGNNYNDGLVANVSSGELILNRAQQDSIAGQLSNNNPMQNLQLSTEISGTNLRIVMNNDNRSKGGSRGYYANIH